MKIKCILLSFIIFLFYNPIIAQQKQPVIKSDKPVSFSKRTAFLNHPKVSDLKQQKQEVIITGKLVNFNNRVVLLDYSELLYLKPPESNLQIVPDTNGNFSIKFNLKEANYFLLGRNELYLSPGDVLNVVIDNNAPEKSVFRGSGTAADNYLKTVPFPKAGSYLDGGFNIKHTLQQTLDTVLQLAQARRDNLKTIKGLSNAFADIERARIEADLFSSFKLFAGLFIRRNKVPESKKDSIFAETKKLLDPLWDEYAVNLMNAENLKVEAFRSNYYSILDSYERKHIPVDAQLKDWQYAYELVYRVNQVDDKKMLATFLPKIDSIKNRSYREAAKETLTGKLEFTTGDEARDFTAFNANDQQVKLSSLKGKVIFIDFWATWCGPCLEEMPYFEKLKKQYESNADIAFIALSVGDNKKIWKDHLKKNNATGMQLFADVIELKAYKILSIPRVVIINKDFRVAMLYGPVPSNPGLKDYLDGLLKK
ncbi:TlpA family protein disulfide reductase [Mucilaginibacter angelicae]|uniref:TlpA family protein disulfide reductase n=1 Tax=Mucilaginibacter angelicae TaxID=869718 RepID=A0ABV6L9Z8_9SPHI